MILKIIIFLLSLFFIINIVLGFSLPKHPNATLIKKIEESKTYSTTYYFRTELSEDRILQFYRELLMREGWEFSEFGGFGKTKGIYNFSKENRHIILKFIPSTQRGVIFYSLTVLEFPKGKKLETSGSLISKETLKEPEELDFLPIYPEAKQLELKKEETNVRVVYVVSGQKNEIKNFYLQEMPSFGWNLVPNKEETEDECSACKAKQNLTKDLINLEFERQNERCEIYIYNCEKCKEYKKDLDLKELGDIIIVKVDYEKE